LFRRASTQSESAEAATASVDADASSRIAASRGGSLIDDYWGNYVAFTRAPDSTASIVMRGPTSSIPCLHVKYEDVNVVFSFMEDCARILCMRFDIDWGFVARSLLGPFRNGSTGISQVKEVLPGHRLEVGDGGRCSTEALWDPERIASERPLFDAQEAAETLEHATRTCVGAWASRHRRVVQHLSGGLDSSIVLGCLASTRPTSDIISINEYHDGADGDEREFARLAAQRAGCRLIEQRRNPEINLEALLDIPRFESPLGLHTRENARRHADTARELGATAIFNGRFGDELFCRHHTRYYVSDFIRDHGLSRGLIPLALDAAITDGFSIWSVLRKGLANAALPSRWSASKELYRDFQRNIFLTENALELALRENPSGREYRQGTPPGKRWQILLLSARHQYYDPFAEENDPEEVTPLLSEPIVETCLRIPTYLQRLGRWDRAIARRAFADLIPEEIRTRRSKGGVEEYVLAIQRRNLRFARELLMDGVLVRQGILDKRKVEAALVDGPSSGPHSIAPLVRLIGREAWARSWRGSTA
jgi:asparagine synthase (glutamine-hydrolysing)